MPNVSFTAPLDYTAESDAINRRRKLAEALQQQSFQPIDPGSVNGLPNPISWTQGLAKMLQAHLGASGQRQADTDQKALAGEMQQRRGADISAYVNALGGRPASQGGLTEDASGNVTQADPQAAQTSQQAMTQALPMIQDPSVQQMALQHLGKLNDPFTLNAGDMRFGPGGVPMARAPEKAKPPMVEHNFPVGENQVQPHISYDDGRTWQPIPGSTPSIKFARQVDPAPPPVNTTTVMHNGVPTVVDARVYRAGSDKGVIGQANKPANTQLPSHALTEQQGHLDAMGIAGNINADIGAVLQQLSPTQGVKGPNAPELQLGPMRNAWNSARNYVGASSAESQNLGTFKATLEKLRNDSLRLNKGVQTEGDAVRAWNEILSNINDQEFVKKRLNEVQQINERAVRQRQMQIDSVRRNYSLEPLDASQMSNQPTAITNAGDRRQTPRQSGTRVVDY